MDRASLRPAQRRPRRPLDRSGGGGGDHRRRHVEVAIDKLGAATLTVHGPAGRACRRRGARRHRRLVWLLAACRELDGRSCLRFVSRSRHLGDDAQRPVAVLAADDLLRNDGGHWLVGVRLYWARTLKRLDVSARTLVALIDPAAASRARWPVAWPRTAASCSTATSTASRRRST
jgi:benzoyl-CoA-dihydrodiol lyase